MINVKIDDDFDYDDKFSKIVWSCSSNGTYYIRIYPYGHSNGEIGSYKFSVTSF